MLCPYVLDVEDFLFGCCQNTPSIYAMAERAATPSAETALVPIEVPTDYDSIATLSTKLTAIVQVVTSGGSVAASTNYAACPTPQRDAVKTAIAELDPTELNFYNYYVQGKYPLPEMNWDENRGPVPTSTRPLKTSRRRAEALRYLYKTDKADPSHAVWFTMNEGFHLPLIKAIVRIFGAQRNLRGGQDALDATQFADLQSVNTILEITARVVLGQPTEKRVKAAFRSITSSQQMLGLYREELRNIVKDDTRKRKREEESTMDRRGLLKEA
jgi:hypothetical protein